MQPEDRIIIRLEQRDIVHLAVLMFAMSMLGSLAAAWLKAR